MNSMEKLLGFLAELEARKIYFELGKIRDSVLVEISVPGERWEVEFFAGGEVEVERFITIGEIRGEEELQVLFDEHSEDW